MQPTRLHSWTLAFAEQIELQIGMPYRLNYNLVRREKVLGGSEVLFAFRSNASSGLAGLMTYFQIGHVLDA